MKKLKSGMLLAFGIALVSCSSDKMESPENENAVNNDVKIIVSITQGNSNGTRADNQEQAQESESKTEKSQDSESEISKVYLILADEDNYVVAVSDALAPVNSDSKNIVTGEFNSSILKNATLNIFAICNQSIDVKRGDNLKDLYFSSTQGNISDFWKSENFTMTSSGKFEFLKEGNTASDNVKKSSSNNIDTYTFNTSIKVSRVAGRFDLSTTKLDFYLNKEGTSAENATEDGITLTLDAVRRFNISNSCYAFKRTNRDAKDEGSTLFGDGTYVIDYNMVAPNKSLYYQLGAGNNDVDKWIKCEDLSGTTDYQTLGYAMENTLPAGDGTKKNLATGVIFRVLVTLSSNHRAHATWENGEALYAYNNVIYGNYESLETSDNSFVRNAYSNIEKNNNLNTQPLKDAELVKKYGFTILSPDENKNYYLYYYYWNEHSNSDELNGPMEYAVVRNYIYRLTITGLEEFGHPSTNLNDPNDPDPIDLNDPVEVGKTKISVEVEVLPWDVKENEIKY